MNFCLIISSVFVLALGGCALNKPNYEDEKIYHAADGMVVAKITNLKRSSNNEFVKFVRGKVIFREQGDIELRDSEYRNCSAIESSKGSLESISCQNIIGKLGAKFTFDSNSNISNYSIYGLVPTSESNLLTEVYFYENGVASKIITNNYSENKIVTFNIEGSIIKEELTNYSLSEERNWDDNGNLVSTKTGNHKFGDYEMKNEKGIVYEKYSVRDGEGLTTKNKYYSDGKLESKEYYILDSYRYGYTSTNFKYLENNFPSFSYANFSKTREEKIFDLILKAHQAGFPLIFKWDNSGKLINSELYDFIKKEEVAYKKTKQIEKNINDKKSNRMIRARQEIYSIGLGNSEAQVSNLYAQAGGFCKTSTVQTIGKPSVDTLTCKLDSSTYHLYYFVNGKIVRIHR